MTIWIATGNPGKVKEITSLVSIPGCEFKSLKDISSYTAPNETGKTFEENALLKARKLRVVKSSDWILSEDSGLVVDGLNGLPGVHSARYAGPTARDIENVSKVLKMLSLRSFNNRKAHFECVMCLISPSGEEWTFRGELKGEISKDVRGTNGFGYDPIFVPDGQTRTLAEMNTSEKNKISHRAKALAQVIEKLPK